MRLRIDISRNKCRSFGKCMSVAPEVFAFDEARKANLRDPAGAPEETILKAAKSCPYRVITVVDGETGEPIFPPARKTSPSS